MLRIGFRSIIFFAVLLPAAPLGAQRLVLTLDAIEHPSFSASGLRLTLASASGGAADIDIARISFAGRTLEKLRFHCDSLRWSGELVECPRGELVAPGATAQRLPLRFSYAPRDQGLDITFEPEPGERWQLRARRAGEGRQVDVTLENARIERAVQWLPPLAAYAPKGRVGGRFSWSGATALAELAASGLSFGNAAGTRAGEKIAANLALRAEKLPDGWEWQADLRLDEGETYWQPFYFAQGGHRLAAAGSAGAAMLSVTRGALELAGVGKATFSGEWDRAGARLRHGQFETGPLDLKQAAPVLIGPLLEQSALPKFSFAGQARLAGAIDERGLSRLDIGLVGASFDEPGGRYALRAADAAIPWRRDEATNADIRIGGASFGRLPLGGFVLPLRMNGLSFGLPRAEIAVLDGKLILEDLHVARKDGEWQWQLGGALEPVSMQLLTESLGLPHMSGSMSASIPKIRHARSTVEMDGALIIQVFDGFVAATNLKLVEPAGRVPRLYADLEMRHFDLGMLTETFSFGSITGFIDGDVKGLELADWRPQRFNARVISSPGDYRKRISQRAVQNISSLGGAGAGAAIQRSFLGFFEQFGYDKLGLSCVLAEGVCEMGGVEDAPNGYVIVKGGGVPAINVIGYNRRVDWEELVARIRRVTEGNAKPIIR